MPVSRFVQGAIFALALVAIVTSAPSQETRPPEKLVGRAVSVSSGDTIFVLVDEERVRVRLADADAPERGQAYAKESRSQLVELAYKKDCEVVVRHREKSGTVVGNVTAGDVSLTSEMLEAGWAWYVPPKSEGKRDEALMALEAKARAEKLGIWADAEPVAPWDWRKLSRDERAALVSNNRSASTVAAGAKGEAARSYWLNTSSGVRHNKSCEWYNNTRHGRYCSAGEGKSCGLCGG